MWKKCAITWIQFCVDKDRMYRKFSMKALIPAAGLGTRWHPWSLVVPKELLPIGRYPAIHHVLEEAVTAGIREIGIVLSETKQMIREYVERVWQSQHTKVNVVWFYQVSPRGVADALLHAKEWTQGNPIAVLYPDEIHPKDGGILQLCGLYERLSGCWLGLTAERQKRRQTIFAVEAAGEDTYYVLGPCQSVTRQTVAYGTGRYILDGGLEHFDPSLCFPDISSGRECDDSRLFAPLWSEGIGGVILAEPILDVGSPINWSSVLAQLGENNISD
jgi:UTP-glucose-1-phosphate uridylyltransferase